MPRETVEPIIILISCFQLVASTSIDGNLIRDTFEKATEVVDGCKFSFWCTLRLAPGPSHCSVGGKTVVRRLFDSYERT